MSSQPGDSRVCEECETAYTPRACNAARQRFCSAQCRKNQWGRERYANDPEFRAHRSDLNRDYHDNLGSLAFARRRLQMRRNKALHRRRLRSLGASGSEGQQEA